MYTQINQRRGGGVSSGGGGGATSRVEDTGASCDSATDTASLTAACASFTPSAAAAVASTSATSPSSFAVGNGKTTKRRVKKSSLLTVSSKSKRKNRFFSKSSSITKGAVLVCGCIVAVFLVTLAAIVGSRIVRILLQSSHRNHHKNNNDDTLNHAPLLPLLPPPKTNKAVASAALVHIRPEDYFGPYVSTSTSTTSDSPPLYRPYDSFPGLGDFTPRYAKLREVIDALLPDDYERSVKRVKELASTDSYSFMPMKSSTSNNNNDNDNRTDAASIINKAAQPYDVYNCPDEPPLHYPYQWPLTRILDHWPPHDTRIPSQVHHGICVFDYVRDYDKAMRYRTAEVPFVIMNDPAVVKTVERWSVPNYVHAMLGDRPYGCEEMSSVHFMYGSSSGAAAQKLRHRLPPRPGHRMMEKDKVEKDSEAKFYTPPKHVQMRYNEWEAHANVSEDQLGPYMPHWYFRLITCGKYKGDVCRKTGEYGSEYILDELPFFQPKENLYLVDPHEQAGIHCRFGMKGLIAENHWDSGRNTIVVLKGMRRYILAHPKECPNLVLYPKGHPSARHSKMNWADYDIQTYPEFANAKANEVIMQPGWVLYLPATWFHYIVSLNTNMQCNTRSGNSNNWNHWVKACGF